MTADPLDLTVGPPGPPEVDVDPAEPGPPPEDELGEPPPGEPLAPAVPAVSQDAVRAILQAAGNAAHHISAVREPTFLRFTDDELAAVVPPLTRIINKRPQLRAAVQRGDEAAVAVALAGYAGRNVQAYRRAQQGQPDQHEPEQPEPPEGGEGGNVSREDRGPAPGPDPNPQADAIRRAGARR